MNNQAPLQVFENNNNLIEEEKCAICLNSLEEVDNPTYIIEECSHKFHTNCLFKWFRIKDSSCPLCRNSINENQNIGCGRTHIFSLVSQYSKKENANKYIVKIMKKYKKQQITLRKNRKELKEFVEEYKEILKTHSKLRNKLRSEDWKLRKIRHEICNIPVVPLFI